MQELQAQEEQLMRELEEEGLLEAELMDSLQRTGAAVLEGRAWIASAEAHIEQQEQMLPELLAREEALLEAGDLLLEDMLSQLRDLFPVKQTQRGWTICDLVLPNSDFTGCEQEEIATALGYVCQLTVLLASWLGVALRYPSIPMSSRSIIR